MKRIKHKFRNHPINPETEVLIIGTFNPDADNNAAEFFYGRERNFLWQLVPGAYGLESLKGKAVKEKLDFIAKAKIDFMDLIAEVEVEEGQETNYADVYLDQRIVAMNDVINEMEQLKHLRKVCFTRKTFEGIPNMVAEIKKVENYCVKRNIDFTYLPTPARFYSADKQKVYSEFFVANK